MVPKIPTLGYKYLVKCVSATLSLGILINIMEYYFYDEVTNQLTLR